MGCGRGKPAANNASPPRRRARCRAAATLGILQGNPMAGSAAGPRLTCQKIGNQFDGVEKRAGFARIALSCGLGAAPRSHLARPRALLGGRLHHLLFHRQALAPPHRIDQPLGQVGGAHSCREGWKTVRLLQRLPACKLAGSPTVAVGVPHTPPPCHSSRRRRSDSRGNTRRISSSSRVDPVHQPAASHPGPPPQTPPAPPR